MDDIERVKTVILSNNDRFYFSWNYDEGLISDQLLKILLLYHSFIEIPILPQLASQLKKDIMRRSIHGTAAIEGNPLSEDEVQSILSGSNETGSDRTADREIINLKKVYRHLREESSFCDLSVATVCSFHQTIMDGIDPAPGRYRSGAVRVGDTAHGGVYKPADRFNDISMLVSEYTSFINSPEICGLDEIVRSTLAHYHLALIHPFSDGNGRTARFIEAYLIKSAGFDYVPALLSNYYYRNMNDYYSAFTLAEKNKQRDITPFIEFVLTGVITSLEEVKEVVLNHIRQLTLRDFYITLRANRRLTERQYVLLLILIENPLFFSLQDLFSKPIFHNIYRSTSERTAQRDLKKLVNMNLLKKNEDGTYELNLRALG